MSSTTALTINIKVHYQSQIRRLTLAKRSDMYHTLMEQIFALYQIKEQAYPLCSIQYYDDDKDLVQVMSDNELLTAIKVQTEIMGQSTLNLVFKTPSEVECSVEQESDGSDQENPVLEELSVEPSIPVLSPVDSSFQEDDTTSSSSDARKRKALSRSTQKASKSIISNLRENIWPSHITHLIIDAESMFSSTKAMDRLTKNEECILAAGKILAKILVEFHHGMKENPLQQIQVLLNEQKLASLVEDNLKTRAFLDISNIQVICAKPARSGGVEELLSTIAAELKTNGTIQSTLIVTDNKVVLKSLKDTETVCVSSKPMIKYMYSSISQANGHTRFFAWVNQECAALGVSPAPCKRNH